MVRVVKKRRSNAWFYGLLVVFVLFGYFAVQYAIFFFSDCNGSAAWSWSRFPPGFTCDTGVRF
jgi:hypothetical protein